MEALLKKIYSMPRLYPALGILSKIIVVLTLPAFLLIVWHGYTVSPFSAIKVCLICGVPFLIVSVARRIINAPRPYELYTFYERAPKNKSGSSFPSRHAFSVFVIATVTLFAYPAVGAVLLLLGVTLCVCRVLTGIHFIRDVLTGALIGVISGIAGVLLFSPFV
mgnify:CR=1 FL=1